MSKTSRERKKERKRERERERKRGRRDPGEIYFNWTPFITALGSKSFMFSF